MEFLGIPLNILLLVIGIFMMLYNIVKTNKNGALLSIYRRLGITRTPLHQLNNELKAKAADFTSVAIITTDTDGLIKSWNMGAQLLFEWKETEVLDHNITIIMPERYRADHLRGMEMAKLTGQARIINNTLELVGLTKSNIEVPIKLVLSQMKHYEDKELKTYYTAYIQDISVRKKAEAETAEKLSILEIGEEIGNFGTWKWDTINDSVTCSRNFNRLFDWGGGPAQAKYFMSRICREDYDMVNNTLANAFKDKKDYHIQYCVMSKDGERTKVDCRGKCYVDDANTLTHIIGVIRVIEQ